MEWVELAVLVGAGLTAGFVAGLVGVGGGSVFAPVLLFYFRSLGLPGDIMAQMTAGTSLFCVLMAAVSSAWSHHRQGAVVWRLTAVVGTISALAVLLTTRLVTTQPWYDQYVFQAVFGVVLIVVGLRMLWGMRVDRGTEPAESTRRKGAGVLAATGAAAGAVSAAAGVGGGIVLVPVYRRLLRLSMHRAVGTSSATIMLITAVGVVSYAAAGWGEPVPATAWGYVDVGRAFVLAGPALLGARGGARASHRLPTRPLQQVFAGLALLVAVKLLYEVLAAGG